MNENKCVLVCVTGQLSCARLINAGAKIAKEKNCPLSVLSVFPSESCYEPDFEALAELDKHSKEHNAQMTVYYDDSPFAVAAGVAKKSGACNIVTGFSKEGISPFISNLHTVLPDIPISMVDEEEKIFNIIPSSVSSKI